MFEGDSKGRSGFGGSLIGRWDFRVNILEKCRECSGSRNIVGFQIKNGSEII